MDTSGNFSLDAVREVSSSWFDCARVQAPTVLVNLYTVPADSFEVLSGVRGAAGVRRVRYLWGWGDIFLRGNTSTLPRTQQYYHGCGCSTTPRTTTIPTAPVRQLLANANLACFLTYQPAFSYISLLSHVSVHR